MERINDFIICVNASSLQDLLNAVDPSIERKITNYVEDRRSVQFYIKDDRLDKIIQEVICFDRSYQEDGTIPNIRQSCRFSPEEVKRAELYVVIDRGAPRERAHWEPLVEFDYTATGDGDIPPPWCWQASPLVFRPAHLPKPTKPLWNTFCMEWCVSEPFIAELQRDATLLRNIGFREIINRRGDVIPGFKQLTGKQRLPLLAPQTTGLSSPKRIRHQGIEYVLTGTMLTEGYYPVLDRELVMDTFHGMPEWSFTGELHGFWPELDSEGEPTPPWPQLVVGRRIKGVLSSFARNQLEFVPITWLHEL